MHNKRGLSAVITTLLIVLLVLVAVGIVWVVIRNMLEEGAEGIGSNEYYSYIPYMYPHPLTLIP